MEKHSETTLGRITQNNKRKKNRRKKMLRWGIRSCFSIFLAAIVTITTVYSQVLYAEAGEISADNGETFTFQEINEADLQLTLPTKVPLEDISAQLLAKWPTLPVLMQDGSVTPDPGDSDIEAPPEDDTAVGDVPGDEQNPGGDDTDSGEGGTDTGNTEGSGVQSPENTPDSGEGVTDTGNTEGSGVQSPENTPDSGEGVTDTGNTEGSGVQPPESTPNPGEGGTDTGNTDNSGVQPPESTLNPGGDGTDTGNTEGSGVQPPESTPDSGEAGTDSAENGTKAVTVIVPDTPVNSAPEGAPAGIITAENGTNSNEAGNNPADNTNSDGTGGNPADNTNSDGTGGNPADNTNSDGTVGDPADNTNPDGTVGDPADDTNSDGTVGDPADDTDSDLIDGDPVDNINSEEPTGTSVPFDLPVKSWVCAYYHEVRASYTFTPVWEDTVYQHDISQDYIPKITVIFENTPGIRPVYTEDDLQSAFDTLPTDGSGLNIVLMNDIRLTRTINIDVSKLSDDKNIVLESNASEDGSGGTICYSLKRYDDNDPGAQPFTGAMLNFYNPEVMQTAGDVAVPFAADQDESGTLLLRNITIDGKKTAAVADPASPENQVDAPAVIIRSGYLILGEDASIINNYNVGTYQVDVDGQPALDENGANLDACGGGVWIRGGALELQKGSHIRGNCAGRSGGGLYLDSGAVLHYYAEADAVSGNLVSAGGSGADLYACAGSTIYYDPAFIDPAFFADKNRFHIDPDAVLIPRNSVLDTTTPIEIYLNVSENSGYTFRQVKEKLESTFGDRVTVLLPQTYIDTTDLRSWYVYDHYDMNCWDPADTDGDRIPDSWEEAYREYLHRPYYVYNSDPTFTGSTSKGDDIPTWLEKTAASSGTLSLAPFKEHIYSRMEHGRPEMTFAGYDQDANVDFLFYNPKSGGQKVVEFDVDSSKVNTHTLEATGFLVNTGIKDNGTDQLLSGYLLYYTYVGRSATQISLERFENVSINSLHNGGQDNIEGLKVLHANSQTIGSQSITNWESRMSIEITVDATEVTVKQWPKDSEDSSAVQSFTWPLTGDTGYNGFGPLVAYKGHFCSEASSFTYSNLRMRYSRPDEERDLLSSLMEADFSQQGNVKKYYLNLLGESKEDYNGTDQMGQYMEFLYLMQHEGIGLITDDETPFKEYLGESGSPNLLELPGLADAAGNRTADLNTVITGLQGYLSLYSSTKLPGTPESIGLKTPETSTPIGNIWLADASHAQIDRTLDGDQLPKDYYIEVMDISCNHPAGVPIKYSLLKPGSPDFVEIGSGVSSEEGTAAFFTVRGATGVNFVITHDCRKWPAGDYIVRQQVGDSKIYGYSYFTLTRTVFTEIPEDVPPAEAPAVSAVSSSGGSAPVMAAPEITVPEVTRTVVGSDGASQPKTGDGMFPAIPVACGACTAFMLKIMLWMYDVDLDVITECKEMVVQSLILWGKGSTRPRIYLAIVALAAVITAYHLVKAFVANSKQIVRERLGI